MTEEIVKESADGIGSSEHDQKMIEESEKTIEQAVQEKVDKQEQPNKEGDRPDWLPEKYKTVEDFLDGHKNLEKKLGEREASDTSEESEEEVKPTDKEDSQDKTGPLDTFYNEYEETGAISEESYKSLEELGYPKDVVDTYIKGYESQLAQYTKDAHEIVGGEAEYNAMAEWAVDNMTPEQLDSYNEQLSLGGDSWEFALRGLHDKYVKSGDAPVERIESGDKGKINQGIQPFTSQEELTAATRSKEYKTSPEFRELVAKRLEISDNATMGANIPNPYAQVG